MSSAHPEHTEGYRFGSEEVQAREKKAVSSRTGQGCMEDVAKQAPMSERESPTIAIHSPRGLWASFELPMTTTYRRLLRIRLKIPVTASICSLGASPASNDERPSPATVREHSQT